MNHTFHLLEASIDTIQEALAQSDLTSVELTTLYLNRIYYYDHNNLRLNAVPLINERVLEDAERLDHERRMGKIRGPLHGIPFTVKDSYMVKGMTVAAGSPAFSDLMASEDSFVVQQLRKAGALLIGKTNMPPMAAGGMQSGLYGRSENPYNPNYLAAAWFSGSSHGSAVATAANFAVFGMAEETVSSGRSPASNNGLVAYTPSRGMISIRGNWPLFPIRDVVVPHTRNVTDLLHILNVIVVEDSLELNDLWRMQKAIALPSIQSVRPKDYLSLRDSYVLAGKRFAVPRSYLGKGASYVRPSILLNWEQTILQLQHLGAEVIEIDFPLQALYEQDNIFLKPIEEKGYLPKDWMINEWYKVNSSSVEQFLQSIQDPNYSTWKNIDGSTVFPNPPDSVYDKQGKNHAHYEALIEEIRKGILPFEQIDGFEEALIGLERLRVELFEQWMDEHQLDALIFPSNGNVGRASAEMDEAANAEAWEEGNYFSHGNYYIRHLGIPTVSLPMGVMADTHVPVNITFAGRAYSDNALLSYCYALEKHFPKRQPPLLTPPLQDDKIEIEDVILPIEQHQGYSISLAKSGDKLRIYISCPASDLLRIFINGEKIYEEKYNLGFFAKEIVLTKYYSNQYRSNGKLVVTALLKGKGIITKTLQQFIEL